MLKIVTRGFSLTCIGRNSSNEIEIVWFFFGDEAIEMLNKHDKKLMFSPILHPSIKLANKFSIDYNTPNFRFDVLKTSECDRLLKQKLYAIDNGKTNTIKFFNEDESQILCENHKIEQESFKMTREACEKIGYNVTKNLLDNYSATDFRINNKIKVQDKVCSTKFHMRNEGRLPYSPDEFDIFQITFIKEKIVFAIPMRERQNAKIISFFTGEQLMKTAVAMCPAFREKYSKYCFDLNDIDQIKEYVKTCEKAHDIPEISDREFHKNLIENNKDKFVSKKRYKKRTNV